MSKLQDIKTVVFDKNLNLIMNADPVFRTLFGNINTLIEFNAFLAKHEMLSEEFSTKLNMSGKAYHVCYKCVDLADTFEFHFFLLSDDWNIVTPTGRHDVHDKLTGLLTERSILSLIKQEIKRVARDKESYTALIIDIAHMKDINEIFGYVKGDKTITTVAHALQSNTRESDILGRYKGDKFIVVLHKTPKAGMAQYLAKFTQVLQGIKFHFDDNVFHAKINYAVTSHQDNDTLDTLLQRLEEGLLECKKNPTSNVDYFT